MALQIRKSVNRLTDTEKAKFVHACLRLKYMPSPISGRTWDTWARWHFEVWLPLQSRLGEPKGKEASYFSVVHGTPAFLPWHRWYTRLLELDLQAVSGDPDLTIPYWDWGYDAALPDPTKGKIWGDNLDDPDPDNYNWFLGGSGTADNDWVVTTGPFAYQAGRWAITFSEGFSPPSSDGSDPGLGKDGPELRRAIGVEPSVAENTRKLATVAQVHEILELPFDTSPWNRMPTPLFDPTGGVAYDPNKHNFFRCRFERDLHNVGHRFVGRTMLRGTAPNDPSFFLHHANVDRIWSKWQDKHLGESYVPLLPVPGVPGLGLDEMMYRFDRTVRSVLDRFALGYDYDGMASDDGFMPDDVQKEGGKPSTPPGTGGGHGHGHGHGHAH